MSYIICEQQRRRSACASANRKLPIHQDTPRVLTHFVVTILSIAVIVRSMRFQNVVSVHPSRYRGCYIPVTGEKILNTPVTYHLVGNFMLK